MLDLLLSDAFLLFVMLHAFAGDAVNAVRVIVFKQLNQIGDGRGVVNSHDVNVFAQRILQSVHKSCGLNGATAQLKEIVVNADAFDAQNIFPHFVKEFFQLALRFHVILRKNSGLTLGRVG